MNIDGKTILNTKSSAFFNIILVFLIFANIFDMSGAMGIKYFSYILMVAYLVLQIQKVGIKKDILLIGFALFVVWPIFSLGWGVFNGGDIALGLTQITAFVVMVIFFLFTGLSEPIKAIRYIYFILFVFGLVVITLFVLIYIKPDVFYLLKLNLLHENGTGYFGFRPLGSEMLPNIYFRATLFLVPAFIYYYFSGKKVAMLVCLGALICAFSKAAFIIIMLFLALSLLIHKFSLQRLITLFLIVALLLGVSFYMPAWGHEIIDSLKGQTQTAQVRINHYDSFKSLLDEKPLYLIIGQGVGTKFYSSATDSFVANIEIDHINTIRKFGFIWFFLFGLTVFKISIKLIRSTNNELKGCGYALILSFIVTGTNPVLLSPLSLMLIVASYRALEGSNVSAS